MGPRLISQQQPYQQHRMPKERKKEGASRLARPREELSSSLSLACQLLPVAEITWEERGWRTTRTQD